MTVSFRKCKTLAKAPKSQGEPWNYLVLKEKFFTRPGKGSDSLKESTKNCTVFGPTGWGKAPTCCKYSQAWWYKKLNLLNGNIVLLHFVLHEALGDAEPLGSMGLDIPGLFQGPSDEPDFDFLQGL